MRKCQSYGLGLNLIFACDSVTPQESHQLSWNDRMGHKRCAQRGKGLVIGASYWLTPGFATTILL